MKTLVALSIIVAGSKSVGLNIAKHYIMSRGKIE